MTRPPSARVRESRWHSRTIECVVRAAWAVGLLLGGVGCAGFASAAAVRHPTVLERWENGEVVLDALYDAETDVRWFHIVGSSSPAAAGSGLAPQAVARMNRELDRAAGALVRAARRHPENSGAAAFFAGFVTPRWLLFEISSIGHESGDAFVESLLALDGKTGQRIDLTDRRRALAAVRATLAPAELAAFDGFAARWN